MPNSAGDHQRVNAFEYQKIEAAIVLEEKNILPNLFIQKLDKALRDQNKMNQMAENAFRFAREDAADKIAEEIFGLLNIEFDN